MNAKEHRQRGLEGCWKRKKGRGRNRKIRSDLWVSFQQSRLAALSSPEHKSWKRCSTQNHNSGFPLLCNDWWNNALRELLCPSYRSFLLYSLSFLFLSPAFSLVFFFLSLAPSYIDSASLFSCSAPLSWCRSEGKCHEGSVSSFSSSLLFQSSNSLRSDFLSCCFLSLPPQPWIQFQSFMGLSEMYKWRSSLLSVLLCLFSSGECHILTLSRVPLLPTPSPVPFICSRLSRYSVFLSLLLCPVFVLSNASQRIKNNNL